MCHEGSVVGFRNLKTSRFLGQIPCSSFDTPDKAGGGGCTRYSRHPRGLSFFSDYYHGDPSELRTSVVSA